jgi:polysaccharide biosynthesis transport protein
VTTLETRYRQALATEQSLRAAFEQQKSETITQNEAAINYRIQEQELATYKDLLNGLLQRAKENDVILAGTSNNVHVDSFALLPRDAVSPRRLRIVAVIFLLSLGLGAGLAVFLDHLDDTVHSSEEAERVLRLPALAVIPALNGASPSRWLRALSPGRQASRPADSETPLIHRMKASGLAEAYRQLRTSVLLSTAGHAPKTLLVTSNDASEGKTTTAVNVAISLAQTGARVLLIDGDMRRPRLHTVFDLPNDYGLSQCLSTEKNMAEVMSCISTDEDSGVFILTSGQIPPNPAELLGSVQMRTLLSELQDHFTHIILDSPPIASVTDAVLISTIVDGVLLVVQYGRCSKQSLRRSRNLLHQVGARIVGVVLNKVDESTKEYRYWGYYGTTTDSVGSEAKQIAGS